MRSSSFKTLTENLTVLTTAHEGEFLTCWSQFIYEFVTYVVRQRQLAYSKLSKNNIMSLRLMCARGYRSSRKPSLID